MKRRRRHRTSRPRPGAIHVLVLVSSLIVATLGLSALQLVRLQSRMTDQSADFIEARFSARAAVELGMLKIRNDPYWRTNLGNGNWLTNQALGNGTCTLSAADPIDNDVTKGDNHPVVLTGVGIKGDARFQTSVRMEVGPRTGSCLEVSMISGNDTTVSGATLTSDQRVSANHNFSTVGGGIVNSDAEAYGSIGGSGFLKAMLQATTPHTLPDAASVLTYYQLNGTPIAYTSLPRLQVLNLVDNGSFETDLSQWSATGSGTCTLQRSTAQFYDGAASLRVTSRTSAGAVPQATLSTISASRINSGDNLEMVMPVFPISSGNFQAIISITSTGSGLQTYKLSSKGAANNKWTDIGGSFACSFTGAATNVTVGIITPDATDFYLDGVSLTDTSYPLNTYYLDRVVLSPTNNPFGPTNAEGIYVIDCANQDVIVQNCRIVGTLVLLNASGGTYIQGSVAWEPGVFNYPALMSDKTLQIATSSTPASESVLGFNMNPAGTPYPYIGGTSNTTLSDSYSSRIIGLAYSGNDLKFTGAPAIAGVVVANHNISVDATSLNLNYSSLYLNNPPPGFSSGAITMQTVPGTWQRTVN